MQRPAYFLSLILLAMASCIGTDFVDEPLGPVPSRLELSHASLSLIEGESQQLSVQIIASDGSLLDGSVSWDSRNPAVATVDPTGLLMAVSSGQVWIDATTQTLVDSLLITVSADPNALASISIITSQMNLSIGDTLQLEVELRNANGELVSDKGISWLSSETDVASVDDEGKVIGLASGATQITASSEGINSLPIPLMVGEDSVSRSGTFVSLNGYSVEGTAILNQAGEKAVLILDDDFRAQNGPGLYVYLSPNSTNVTGGISLGELKAQSGRQTYDLPDNVNPDDFDHVLVYCQPFRVPFGTAEFQ